MQRVTGAIRGDLSNHRTADQGEIAEKVENLVTDELVAKTKGTVDDVLIVEACSAGMRRSLRSERTNVMPLPAWAGFNWSRV